MDKVLDKKRTYIGYDGDEYIDMCIPVVKVKEITGNAISRVTEGDNGRLDNFVWNNVKKDLDMIDVTMYANHIFNPFSIKAGDMLYVPVDKDNIYQSEEEPSLPDGTKHSSNSRGEKTMSYADTVAYLAKRGLGVK